MMANGGITRERVLVANLIRKDKKHSRDSMLMIKRKVKVSCIWAAIVIRDSGKMIKEMDLGFFMILMVLLRRGNTKMTNK